MDVVINPSLRTLIAFLKNVRRNAPANFTKLMEEKGASSVARYIKFCLRHKLIHVVSVHRGGGRPRRTYDLTGSGATLLIIFKEVDAVG